MPAPCFQLTAVPETGHNYGWVLHQNQPGARQEVVASVAFAQRSRVCDAVLAAARTTGADLSTLSPSAPIELAEPAGVRLGLILMATGPLKRLDRVYEVSAGINAMSTEETYYWYSKCSGQSRRRGLAALRTLLSTD